MGELTNRTALITGGARGIGFAISRRLAADGAHVVVVDIDGPAANKAAEEIERDDGSATAREVDVSSLDALCMLFSHIERDCGQLDILVLNAGVEGPVGLDIEEAEFDRTVGVNFKSQFFGASLALPLMRRAGSGSIILISSIAALRASVRSPLYGALKAATISLSMSLARLAGPDQIRANVICPGLTDTDMARATWGSATDGTEDPYAALAKAVPLGRSGQPADIAEAAFFLASDASRYMTGGVLTVDGGFTV